jgi:hypothetical protein
MPYDYPTCTHAYRYIKQKAANAILNDIMFVLCAQTVD